MLRLGPLRKRAALATVLFLLSSVIAPSAYSYTSKSIMPSWANQATIYEVNIRQYTSSGTFREFEGQLERLSKLGVKILWLMPIHPISQVNRKGTLGSPYSVADYKGINPEFGNSTDFKNLVTSAHRLGFKIILDWVANHSGWDNPWLENKDWYHQDSNGNVISPNPDWSDVAWLDYTNQEMRNAMLDAMTYWVKEFDIDGFRADVASGVPNVFWETANQKLQTIKPLFMLAEDQYSYGLTDNAFISNYNWALMNQFRHISAGSYSDTEFTNFATNQFSQYPTGTFPMNFITNHDENSWNYSEFSRYGDAANALGALTFVYPGIPLIYSGQEVGNKKQLAFFEKDLIPSIDQPNDYTTLYKHLISLKKANKALWNDAPLSIVPIASDKPGVLAFARVRGNSKVIYVLNQSRKSIKFTLNLKKVHKSPTNYSAFSSNKITKLSPYSSLNLKPFGFEIYSTSPSL